MTDNQTRSKQPAFFGSLPRTGIWTVVHLSLGQFSTILVLSLAIFLFTDGPLWAQIRGSHFNRIIISYTFIPAAVAAALAYNQHLRLSAFFSATLAIGMTKLVLTALLVMLIGLLPR